MTRSEQLTQWREALAQQRSSGLSVREWCEENGVKRNTFYYRRQILHRSDGPIFLDPFTPTQPLSHVYPEAPAGIIEVRAHPALSASEACSQRRPIPSGFIGMEVEFSHQEAPAYQLPERPATFCSLTLPNGFRIDLSSSFDTNDLQRLLQLLTGDAS